MQTEENGNMIMTEVDKFIASPGYQAFWANERNKDYEKAQIMMQLPEEIYGSVSYNEKLVLMEAMSEIVGF